MPLIGTAADRPVMPPVVRGRADERVATLDHEYSMWVPQRAWPYPSMVTRSDRRERQICHRQPWGLRRQLRRHRGETGIIIYGWFMRWRLSGYFAWSTVGAKVDGEFRGVVQQLGLRLLWISVPAGKRRLDLDVGQRRQAFQAELDLAEGQVVLIAFKPPTWVPFRKPGEPTWCQPRTVVEPV
jgi:hypothetical protein